MIEIAKNYLQKYFGYKEFRKGQELIIDSVLQKKNTLGIMPTGGGKSLCYQIPALCFEGLTIVISPLISLMKDQIDFLYSINYPAEMLNSTITFQQQRDVMSMVENKQIKVLYLTPERFRSSNFLEWISAIDISIFAIDEAHCISEWGHDFRPEYRRLSTIIKELGDPIVLALTATATKEVRDDIIKALDMKTPNIFVSGFNRDNLIYGVQNHISEEEKNKALIEFINKISGAGIVYTSSIKTAESLFNVLKSNLNRKVGLYHGSLPPQIRKKMQDDFLANKIDVLIATNAFGMGVNKLDIRFVVHYSIPGTIEAYYQETGRAGRDGKISYCLILEYDRDIYIQKFFIEAKNPSFESLLEVLVNIKKYSKNDNLYIDDYSLLTSSKLSNFKIDAILKQLHFINCIDFEFIAEEKIEINLRKTKPKTEDDINFLDELKVLKDYDSSTLNISTKQLAKRFDLPERILKEKLLELSEKKIIEYNIIKSGKTIKILKDNIPPTEEKEYNQKLTHKKEIDQAKLDAVIQYGNLCTCRRKYLLNYFGEEFKEDNCGKCDICRGTYKNINIVTFNEIQKEIIFFALKHSGKVGKLKLIKILKGSYDLEPKYREFDECGNLKSYNLNEIESELNILLKNDIIQIKDGKYPTIRLSNKGLSEIKKNSVSFK